ncbi:MAG: branched-chain amino acid ABC transporter permease [Phycisphaerales bacterium]
MAYFSERTLALKPPVMGTLLRSIIPVVIGIGVALLLQFAFRPIAGDYWSKITLDICTNIILAVSLTMVNGFTGQFSIGHAAFMAIGAYASACIVYYGSMHAFGDARVHGGLLSTMRQDHGGPLISGGDLIFVGSLLVGGLVAALCGYLVGLPSLRLKGDYLAIVTLGFGEIVRLIITAKTRDVIYSAEEVVKAPIYELPLHLGGGLGFSGLPFYTSLFWVGLFASLTLIVAYRLKQSTYGRAFLSIREDEIAAEAMGINTTRYKVQAFVFAAFFAGIGGGLFAHTFGVQLNPGELGFIKSFDILILVVIGGLGSISGATIAAIVLTSVPELLREPRSVWPWGVIGAVVVASAMAAVSRRKLTPFLMLGGVCVGWELLRFGAAEAGINLAEYRMVLYALVLILMMILRPEGLMGLSEIWDLRWGGRSRGAAKGAT